MNPLLCSCSAGVQRHQSEHRANTLPSSEEIDIVSSGELMFDPISTVLALALDLRILYVSLPCFGACHGATVSMILPFRTMSINVLKPSISSV
jgi:hypothetical protein